MNVGDIYNAEWSQEVGKSEECFVMINTILSKEMVIVAPLMQCTSKEYSETKHANGLRFAINKGQGGMIEDSIMLVDHSRCVNVSVLKNKIGRVSKELRKFIAKKIQG